jgi:CRP-like cAMP-binding protein
VQTSALTANVFEHDPDLLAGLSGDVALIAEGAGEANVIKYSPGAVELTLERCDGFGLLVLEGFLCRIVRVTGRTSVEILGRGDVLRPWEDGRRDAPVPVESADRALTEVRLAVLDREFAHAVAPWPAIAEAIGGRLLERARWLALQLALTRVRRIEDRLHVLLWHLADRWGRVERDGTIFCSVSLTHDLLAGMVGAQRPTVTTAMAKLGAEGQISRRQDGWILQSQPPTESDLEGRALADAFRLRPED